MRIRDGLLGLALNLSYVGGAAAILYGAWLVHPGLALMVGGLGTIRGLRWVEQTAKALQALMREQERKRQAGEAT